MHLTQGIHRPLQQVPDNVALEHDGRQVTFRQFADRVTRLAAGLHSIGVGEGDRVAMLSLNSIEYVEYYYAVWWAGAVANPINVRWAVAEIVYSLEDSDTTYMIVDAGFRHLIDEIRSKAPLLKKIVDDLQRDYARWCDKVREFELATVSSSAGEPSERAEALEAEVQALAVDIESYAAEINYLGVPFSVQDLFGEIP